MTRRSHILLPALLLALAAAEAASAQIVRESGARIRNMPAVAEVSLNPLELQGSLEGQVLIIPMISVTLTGRTHPVLMERHKGSTVGVRDVGTRDNGLYSVRYTLPWVSGTGQVQIRNGGPQGPALATCPLAQDVSYNSVEQHCEAQVTITDGKIHVLLELTSGNQAEVSQITVRRLQ